MKILVLSTWFPYPPNHGSKNRAYHLIKALAREHELAVVSFEDGALQPEWLAHIREFCARVEVVSREPFRQSRLRRWAGWLSIRPSAVIASYSTAMSARVRQVATEWKPDLVFALTYATAPYALELRALEQRQLPFVLDIDILLGKMLYEHYQAATHPLERARRFLAHWKFEHYERWLFRQFQLCLVTSAQDRQRVITEMSLADEQVGLVPNGVDVGYYRPGLGAPAPFQLIYSGALTYSANYDAMDYFLKDVFPLIQRQVPEASLQITGSTSGVALEALALNSQVTFTGYVDDIRPLIAGSSVCVVPLRQGAGTRLKILEAMALGTPVVSTPKGAEGLEVEGGQHLLLADGPAEFAAQTVRLLRDPLLCQTLTTQALQRVREKYAWADIGQQFCQWVSRYGPNR